MDPIFSRLQYLFRRFRSGEASPEERQAFFEMINSVSRREMVKELITEEMTFLEKEGLEMQDPLDEERAAELFEGILLAGKDNQTPVIPMGAPFYKKRRTWIGWAAAAVFLLLAGSGAWWLSLSKTKPADLISSRPRVKQDIPPGTMAAVLTLADGKRIALDSTANGIISHQGNMSVVNLNGQLAYKSVAGSRQLAEGSNSSAAGSNPSGANSNSSTANEIPYNTIQTQRGNQYQIVLPDGSQVWLNAASSIRFPVAFTGRERTVEITGEAYFEIAKNPGKPFRVLVAASSGKGAGTDIKVLGTHFNVNAYANETVIATTLLEGAVSVTHGEDTRLIKPGEQARVEQERGGQGRGIKVTTDVNADEIVAWKNQLFYFKSADIHTVMRQLSRWYDIDPDFGTAEIQERFYAKIPRNVNISEVLKALSLTEKVHFTIEGKKVIIKP
ncbi:FecR family protein [Flavitalea flava]